LILITHDRVLVVELKHWVGRITSEGGQWFQNGSARGKSPVSVTGEKIKVLKEHLKRRDPRRFADIWVDMRIVLTAKTDFSGITDPEREYVLPIQEFVRAVSSPNIYRNHFREIRRATPLYQEKDAFNRFFIGQDFKAAEQKYLGFKADGPPTFVHPDELFSEYLAVHSENPRRRALLRLWNARELAIRYQTPAERDRLFKREGRVLSFLKDNSPELAERNCLPILIGEPDQEEATGTFFQLFDLSVDRLRLSHFIARHESKLTEAERLSAIRALLSVTADIHRAGVAHCDLGDHALWFGRDARLVVSGFTAAQYPEEGTLGSARSSLVASHLRLPEDVLGGGSTGFSRDVFHVAVAAYRLAYLSPPPLADGVPEWTDSPRDFCGGAFDTWFRRALDHDFSQRPKNAIELAEEFARLDKARQKPASVFDVAKLLRFQTDVVPFAKYPLLEQVPSTHSKIHYVSRAEEKPVHVKVFTEARVDPDPHRSLAVFRLLTNAENWQQVSPGYAPILKEFGLTTVGAFCVETKLEGSQAREFELTDAAKREQAALWLALEVRHLHGTGLAHGDLCDRNVLLSSDAVSILKVSEALSEVQKANRIPAPAVIPLLIDTIEYVPPGGTEPHTPAFAPPYVEKCSPAERDRYAVHVLVARMLGLAPARVAEAVVLGDGLPRHNAVREQLQRELNSPVPILSLDPLIQQLTELVAPRPNPRTGHVTVTAQNIGASGSIDGGEDGIFAQIEFPEGPGSKQVLITLLSAAPEGLEIEWDIKKAKATGLRLRRIPFHLFSRLANADDSFRVKAVINYAKGPLNLGVLEPKLGGLVRAYAALQARNEKERREQANGTDEVERDNRPRTESTNDEGGSQGDLAELDVAVLWKVLLDIENSMIPQVQVKECRRTRNDEIVVTYGEESLSFPEHDDVTVRRLISGNRTRIVGRLDIRSCRAGELVIRRADGVLNPGDILSLESKLAKASYERRRAATDRILRGESREARLKNWLDPSSRWPKNIAPRPCHFESAAELANEYGLNQGQGDALWGAITGPPVTLVQGPPGTGKTTFISALCHYLTEIDGASNVLVASQSHEAVDNAAEAIATLYHRRNAVADLVRVGSTENVAADLSPFHASTWRQIYLNKFDVEWTTRLETFSRELGIDSNTFAALLEIFRSIGPLLETYEALDRRSHSEELEPEETDALTEDKERLLKKLQHAFGREVASPRQAYEAALREAGAAGGALNPRSLNQLEKVIKLAFEWRDVLAMSDSRFDEFLVKTKQIVCGTCVGLGAASYGLVDARYDWVIVDEAGRCTPSELAVAIQSGHRVVLVGDHLQLPPFFDQQVREAVREKFPAVPDQMLFASDFERIFDRYRAAGAGFSLYGQHRMAPAIGDLVSDLFYDGRLTTERGEAAEWTQHLPATLDTDVMWIDTAAVGPPAWEGKERHGTSFSNRYEADVVVKLLEEIDACDALLEILLDPVRPVPIGVICPYAGQAALIRSQLAKSSVSPALQARIKVGTVDSYQGKQNDLIILSLTRANQRGDIGFVRDRARANVSLSRAKERLIIVGSSDTWGHPRAAGSPFGNVLSYIRSRQGSRGYAIVESQNRAVIR
jgi:serine/threonine protein kinase/DNA polymerase III delta prime subunit